MKHHRVETELLELSQLPIESLRRARCRAIRVLSLAQVPRPKTEFVFLPSHSFKVAQINSLSVSVEIVPSRDDFAKDPNRRDAMNAGKQPKASSAFIASLRFALVRFLVAAWSRCTMSQKNPRCTKPAHPPTCARASAANGVLRYRSPVEQATVTIIFPLF